VYSNLFELEKHRKSCAPLVYTSCRCYPVNKFSKKLWIVSLNLIWIFRRHHLYVLLFLARCRTATTSNFRYCKNPELCQQTQEHEYVFVTLDPNLLYRTCTVKEPRTQKILATHNVKYTSQLSCDAAPEAYIYVKRIWHLVSRMASESKTQSCSIFYLQHSRKMIFGHFFFRLGLAFKLYSKHDAEK
jgi:hypothetical protein